MSRRKNKKTEDLNFIFPGIEARRINFGIDRMREVLKYLEIESQTIPAIQVAGTNGKGSIASFIQSSLKMSGIKTGVTTSPHIISWRERIAIDGNIISKKNFYKYINELKPLIIKYNLTSFEIMITTAIKYFISNNVDLIILEVGLGGRLDATTAYPHRSIFAIGPIGLDHCEYLGDSLTKITREKGAIITKNSIIITAKQHPEVEKILKEIAVKQTSQIKWVNRLGEDWTLGLEGDFQRENAAVAKGALEALNYLGWNIEKNDIIEGFKKAYWPGRLQKVFWRKKMLIIDGAHNPHAAKKLAKERKSWSKEGLGIKWILSIQKNKDAPKILNYLIKSNDIAWIVPLPDNESWEVDDLIEICPDLSKQLIKANNVETALSQIEEIYGLEKIQAVITGSLFLIGHVIEKKIISMHID